MKQDELPPEVAAAAQRLLELFHKSGGKVATPQAEAAAGQLEIVEILYADADELFDEDDDDEEDEIDDLLEELQEQDAEERAELIARGIVTQPRLPKIFRLVIENYNARMEIHAKGTGMSQAEWRQLKELYRDMKESLRPGAERALSRAPV
jgi:hypothetical protein